MSSVQNTVMQARRTSLRLQEKAESASASQASTPTTPASTAPTAFSLLKSPGKAERTKRKTSTKRAATLNNGQQDSRQKPLSFYYRQAAKTETIETVISSNSSGGQQRVAETTTIKTIKTELSQALSEYNPDAEESVDDTIDTAAPLPKPFRKRKLADDSDDEFQPTEPAAKSRALAGENDIDDYGTAATDRPIRKLRSSAKSKIIALKVQKSQAVNAALGAAPIFGSVNENGLGHVGSQVGSASNLQVQTSSQASISALQSEFQATPTPAKRRKVMRVNPDFWDNAKYKIRFRWTPFEDHIFPTAEQAAQVHELLVKDLKERGIAAGAEERGDGPAHGAAKNITVDAIVRTVMAQATTNEGALLVQRLLIKKFTYTVDGKEAEGTIPNYHRVRVCEHEKLANVIKPAGIYNNRARFILSALDLVYTHNKAAFPSVQGAITDNAPNEPDFVPGILSLDFLLGYSQIDACNWLLELEGVGVKTACCILEFNLGFPLCAVDTHVQKMAMWHGWLPRECTDLNRAFLHLDARLPDEYKHGIHQGFWHHRQYCRACKKDSDDEVSAEDEATCILADLMTRFRVSKKALLSKSPTDGVHEEDTIEATESTATVKVRKTRGKGKRKEIKGEEAEEETTEQGSKQEAAEKPRKLSSTLPFNRLTPERAAELGYEAVTVAIDDDFDAGSVNKKVVQKWVLVEKEEITGEKMEAILETKTEVMQTTEEKMEDIEMEDDETQQ